MSSTYVHGYQWRESDRLRDQADTLVELLHHDTHFPPGSRVLEAGCGVGAQTVTLASRNPCARITSVDINLQSIEQARRRIVSADLTNVVFAQGDVFNLPFGDESFDYVFVCFVLEHLRDPAGALAALKRLLRPGGSIIVIEGDHGSVYFHPDSADAHRAIDCLVQLQRRSGGDAMIGRALYPLLDRAGFSDIHISPRMVYVDASHPELVDGFTRRTFTAMIEGVREQAIASGLIDADVFDRGVRALYRTAESDGVFCYSFFKAAATKS